MVSDHPQCQPGVYPSLHTAKRDARPSPLHTLLPTTHELYQGMHASHDMHASNCAGRVAMQGPCSCHPCSTVHFPLAAAAAAR